LQNGCICCTLREDLLEQVSALAAEKAFDYIVIESTGVSEPLPVAETFTFELAPGEDSATADGTSPPKSLNSVARLDTLVTVVDASSFLLDLDTLDDLSDRGWEDKGGHAAPAAQADQHESGAASVPKSTAIISKSVTATATATGAESSTAAVPAASKRSSHNNAADDADDDDDAKAVEEEEEEEEEEEVQGISTLLVDQIEFANVIVINKCDLVTEAELTRVKAVVHGLNPGAIVLESVRGNVPVDRVIDTNLFSMDEASNAAGWLKEARGEHTPETEEYGVSSFVFRARRPFHPARLGMLLDSDAFSSGREHGTRTSSTAAVTPAEAATDRPGTHDSGAAAAAASEVAEEDEAIDPESAAGKAMAGKCGFVIRSKGLAWLAGDNSCANDFAGEWSHAGRRVELAPMARWVAATLPHGQAPPADAEVDWWSHDAGVGDRRIEVVIIGLSLDKPAMRAALDACLLTDAEWALGPSGWASIPNPIWGDMDWPALHAAMDAAEEEQEEEGRSHS
jgi:G3E family GTPase